MFTTTNISLMLYSNEIFENALYKGDSMSKQGEKGRHLKVTFS